MSTSIILSSCKKEEAISPINPDPVTTDTTTTTSVISPLGQDSTLWKLAWQDEFDYEDDSLENNWISQNGSWGEELFYVADGEKMP